jgi:hypothetical protein
MSYFINGVLVFAFVFFAFLMLCTVVFGFALLIFGKRDTKQRASQGD